LMREALCKSDAMVFGEITNLIRYYSRRPCGGWE
jgi:hypothetical protein